MPILVAAALAADDGDLDLTFGLFGRAVPGSGYGVAVLAHPDGALRVGFGRGRALGIQALTENGAVDTSFGTAGETLFSISLDPPYSNYPVALLERPNGRLLLVGNLDDEVGTTPVLLQVTADGDPDPDFGTDGVRMVSVNFLWDWVKVSAAALQSDGKVVLAGTCVGCLASGASDTFVARFLSTGAADPDFGTNGWAVWNADEIGDGPSYALAVAIDGSSRIVVGGSSNTGSAERPFVARLLSDGDPDPTFAGANGIATIVDVAEQAVTSLAIDPVSKAIVVATSDGSSSFPANAGLARLTQSGTLDADFSNDGVYPLTLEEGTNLTQILLQSDGKIVTIGTIDANGTQLAGFLLARFRATGTLDPTFDGNGLKRIEFDLDADARDFAMAATLAGGRIVAVGGAPDNGGSALKIAVLRTQSALIFSDGFERGSRAGWVGN